MAEPRPRHYLGGMPHTDIAIIGAGPAGLAFARSLSGTGLRVTLVERSPERAIAEPAFDGREIALTLRSQRILRGIGAWDRIPMEETSPLREARVLDGHSPFALRFAPEGEESLGRLVPNHLIRRALHRAVTEDTDAVLLAGRAVAGVEAGPAGARLRLEDGEAVEARLVVAADTRFSDARRRMGIGATVRDFRKTMLVARVAHERPHGGVATEWFGHGQTVAMLPLRGDVSSVVLTLDPHQIAALMAMEEGAFGAEVTRRYAGRLGAMRLAGTRHAYPLVATYAHRFAAPRFALVGDAAVGMHPVTAHGFNFGLAGAHRLARSVAAAVGRGRDPSDRAALLAYESAHRRATWPMFTATNAIATLYTDDTVPGRLLRTAVMRAGGALAPVRRAITSRLMEASPA